MVVPTPVVQLQGQATVSADNLNTYIQVITNVAQLRTFIGLSNMCIHLLGITVANDGLGGPFYYNATSTATDDSSTVIRPSGVLTGAWLRLGYYAGTPSTTQLIYLTQLRQGLLTIDTKRIIPAYLPSDPYNGVNNIWYGALTVIGDDLYQFIRDSSLFGGTDPPGSHPGSGNNALATAFYQSSALLPITPLT